MPEKVKHVVLEDLPKEAISDKLTRQVIFGEGGNIGVFVYKKGAVVPLHHHVNEQFSLITKGSVKVSIEGRDYIVKAGEVIIIPPNVPHQFEAIEDDTYDIDFFTPLERVDIYRDRLTKVAAKQQSARKEVAVFS